MSTIKSHPWESFVKFSQRKIKSTRYQTPKHPNVKNFVIAIQGKPKYNLSTPRHPTNKERINTIFFDFLKEH
jgi:hypothetical protein